MFNECICKIDQLHINCNTKTRLKCLKILAHHFFSSKHAHVEHQMMVIPDDSLSSLET